MQNEVKPYQYAEFRRFGVHWGALVENLQHAPRVLRRPSSRTKRWIAALAFVPFGLPSYNRARFPQYGWVLGTKIVLHLTCGNLGLADGPRQHTVL